MLSTLKEHQDRRTYYAHRHTKTNTINHTRKQRLSPTHENKDYLMTISCARPDHAKWIRQARLVVQRQGDEKAIVTSQEPTLKAHSQYSHLKLELEGQLSCPHNLETNDVPGAPSWRDALGGWPTFLRLSFLWHTLCTCIFTRPPPRAPQRVWKKHTHMEPTQQWNHELGARQSEGL